MKGGSPHSVHHRLFHSPPPPHPQKNAIAVAHCKRGKGILKVNGNPIELLEPETLRHKIFEPVLIVGADKFKEIDIRVRVRGGGNTSQVYGTPPTPAFRLPSLSLSRSRAVVHQNRRLY